MATAAIGLGISGITALAGLFANRKKQQEQRQTQTQDINELSSPEYDPKTQIMRDTLMNHYLDRLGSDDDFFKGYTQTGLRNINQSYDNTNESINNLLASRGLGRTSAGASSLVGNAINRGNQQSSFMNTIPQLQDQRSLANLQGASGFFNQLPIATRRSGQNTSTTVGNTEIAGNELGGTFGGLANSLFGLYGAGAFTPKKPTPTMPAPQYGYDPTTGYDPSGGRS
jgi:hypothetical protein